MNNTTSKNENKWVLWAAKRAALVIFDVLAGYFSFFLALVMRFYANGEFLTDANIYLETFYEIAPYCSVILIVVFAAFGLYGRRWKYAGFYDMFRIVLAHVTVFVLLFDITYFFFIRMPLTFYFLGTAMLFCLICLSRFSLAIINYLSRKIKNLRNARANVMIVGTGDTANYVRRQFENNDSDPARVKCFFSYDSSGSDSPINGIPVLKKIERLESYFKEYKIDLVCFASRKIPEDVFKKLTEVCETAGVDTRDYSDAMETDLYALDFNKLMRCTVGAVRVRTGEKVFKFLSGEEARKSFPYSGRIESISVEDGVLTVDLSAKNVEKNDINEEWVKKTEAETGESISFF
ncbi:MAG: hypothetical protein Q4E35_03865 [Eubacteriales bacterium]|nr:hypothetical protein [Eubacteriales bacterium]